MASISSAFRADTADNSLGEPCTASWSEGLGKLMSQGTMAMALGAFHLAISCGDTLDMRSRSCVDGSPACLAAQVISESMSAQHTELLDV